ncbi:MAG: hypothetical protein U5N85_13605 [Arcicella sp.]|nr:hypothetical protein [Arcicella sp.]
MKNNRFSSESIVATMASFVGICALIVSITQTHYQRKIFVCFGLASFANCRISGRRKGFHQEHDLR